MNNFIFSLIVTVLGGLIVWFVINRFSKKKDQLDKNQPVLVELRKLLTEVETEINCFADKETTRMLSANTRVHNDDKVLANVNNCGGSLSWIRIFNNNPDNIGIIQKVDNILSDRFLPHVTLDDIKGKLVEIKDLLEKFYNSIKDFNRRWPSDHSIEMLEQKNETKLSEEACDIESKADLIKGNIVKLKDMVDKAMNARWSKIF